MKRLIYNKLLEWKDSKSRKPLILLGARQVGKTYILNQFGRQEFQSMLYVNCHNNPFASALFRDFDIDRIIYDLEQHYEQKITDGSTLLVFDEIQEVHNGLSSLKYFCEERRSLHVAVAGSLLGISLRRDESYPVGKVDTIRMYPMTFGEFVLAGGREKLYVSLSECRWENLNTSHELLTDLLRQYYFSGGMPEAVKEWFEGKDAKRVRRIQTEILDAYERDIAKHTSTMAARIHQVWNSIPAQLAKENKKFIFGILKKGARAAEYELALQWLIDAGLVYRVERCKVPGMPLKFYADNASFKIYMNDVGLLAAMAETEPKDILLGNKAFSEFKGAFSENYVLEQLKSLDSLGVFYYSKDNSQLEIDFLLQCSGRIIPLEVKAEENVKSKSLATFVRNSQIEMKGLRASMKPYISQDWMENIPMYGVEGYFKCAENGSGCSLNETAKKA